MTEAIRDRIKELKQRLAYSPPTESKYFKYMLSGEIKGLIWVLEEIIKAEGASE